GNKIETGGGDDGLALFDVRAFEADHQRHLEAEVVHGVHDAARDAVAGHDAAEDVDQQRLHVRVGTDDFKSLGDRLFAGGSAHVEEVRRLLAIVRDDVHRRHRESRTVHHAADVAIEFDVAETVLRGLDFAGILLRIGIAAGFRLAVQRVFIDYDLAVENHEVAGGVDRERVDLEHGAVGFDVHLVERAGDVGELRRLRPGESQEFGSGPQQRVIRPAVPRRPKLEHLFRRLFGDLFDVHATIRAEDEHDVGLGTVERDGEVQLARYLAEFFEHHGFDAHTFGSGLMRDQGHADHLFRRCQRIRRTPEHLDAARLAAATRERLRLGDARVASQGFEGGGNFGGREDDLAARYGKPRLAQEAFTLILV